MPLGNLPHQLTSFVGRRAEALAAKRLLARERLVTLIGAGGVGKTRLAVRVAEAHKRTYADGVWLVELDEIHDETLVAQAVATVLDVHEVGGRPSAAVLADHLAGRELLLVLDNCEHVAGAVARLAAGLLRAGPGLRILATSREPLDIPGEVRQQVPPLPTPDPGAEATAEQLALCDAVALFVDRARAVAPGFALTEQNAEAVARVCHRLDGVPLAIELAAAWLGVLSPEQLDDRLGDRLALLTRGNRAAPSRHQTLRACIAWSFDRCTARERRLWARLSVFAGGFELDAVEQICDGTPGLLASLVAKSVVTSERHGPVMRYRMLETIRGFGLAQLREPEIRRRHRDFYERLALAAAADWVGPRQVEWLDRLERAHPEIRAALEYAVTTPGEAASAQRICFALHPYWLIRGVTSEGRRWLGRALEAGPEPTVDRLKGLFTATVLSAVQGDIGGARALAEQARELGDRLGDRWSVALATLTTAAPCTHSGDPAGGAERTARALEGFRAENDVYWTVMALAGLAMVQGFLGDAAGAADSYEDLLSMTQELGEIRSQSLALWALGVGLWTRGDPDGAAERLEESLRLRSRMNDTFGAALCLDALAWIAAYRGQARLAAVLLGVVATLTRSVGAPTAATYPDLVAYHDECVKRAREALGEREYAQAVAQGEKTGLADAVAYALAGEDTQHRPAARPRTPAPEGITRREWEICELVAEGLTNREIAARLVISPRTAESHVQHVLDKLGFANRGLIAAWAEQQRELAAAR